MFKLLKYWKKNKVIYIVFIIILLLIETGITLLLPYQISNLIDKISNPNNIPPLSEVIVESIILIAMVLGLVLILCISKVVTATFTGKYTKEVRSKIFSKVNELSVNKINEFSIASLITRTTDDVIKCGEGLYSIFTTILSAPIMLVVGMAMLLWDGFKIEDGKIVANNSYFLLTIVPFAIIIILIILFIIVLKIAVPRFKRGQKYTDDMSSISRDCITGVQVVRAFNAENFQTANYNKTVDLTRRNRAVAGFTVGCVYPLVFGLLEILQIVIYFLGAYIMYIDPNTNVTYALLVKVASLSAIVVWGFLMFAMVANSVPSGMISAKRIREVVECENDIVSPQNPITTFKEKGTLEFKNVTFKYKSSDVNNVDNISFKVKKGETIAMVGYNGSGKSTIIDLIPRFYDPAKGEIYVDGVDVKKIDLKCLRDKISYISQKAFLFSGNIKNNIITNDSINEEMLESATRTAQLYEFVNKLPDKYETSISQLARNLSGGQKQRISVARALAKNPEIIIFDDSFSALDFKTDKALRNDLMKQYKECTKIIIAQRIATIMNADQIYVIDGGRILDSGSHKQLFKRCEVYRKLTLSQMSEKEATHA